MKVYVILVGDYIFEAFLNKEEAIEYVKQRDLINVEIKEFESQD